MRFVCGDLLLSCLVLVLVVLHLLRRFTICLPDQPLLRHLGARGKNTHTHTDKNLHFTFPIRAPKLFPPHIPDRAYPKEKYMGSFGQLTMGLNLKYGPLATCGFRPEKVFKDECIRVEDAIRLHGTVIGNVCIISTDFCFL